MSKASGGGSSKGGASKSRGKDSKDVITKVVDHTRNVAISHFSVTMSAGTAALSSGVFQSFDFALGLL